MQTPSQALTAIRNITDPARANVTVPIARPGLMHRLVDPDAGDTLMVITAGPPGRGFVRRQDFVELSLLELIHGVVIQPNSDDVIAEIASDKITLSRPGGSDAVVGGGRRRARARRRCARSSMSTNGAATSRKILIDNEWTLGLGGVLSVLFGVILLVVPGAGAIALIWMIASYAIVFGVLLVMAALSLKKHKTA